jgi:hypothetical protein
VAYRYERCPGKLITVIIGSPAQCPYRALSFVWDQVTPTDATCLRCGKSFQILVSSSSKILALMQLAGTGHPVWLDFLSIDQNKHQGIKPNVRDGANVLSSYFCFCPSTRRRGAISSPCCSAVLRECASPSFRRLPPESGPEDYLEPDSWALLSSYFSRI